jgi:hypothetical protein
LEISPVLYNREQPISVDHARRFASACITARERFALRFDGRKVYVTGQNNEAEIERLITETAREGGR